MNGKCKAKIQPNRGVLIRGLSDFETIERKNQIKQRLIKKLLNNNEKKIQQIQQQQQQHQQQQH